jgi:cytochrome c biogenesis protein CcmG/thiol:disulfide interchange protein DsbE
VDCAEKRVASQVKPAPLRKSACCWIFVAAVLLLLVSAPVGSGIQAAQNGLPAIGAAAIDFELTTLDGEPVRLATFRGKPLMINFFASWCDPCRDEMPILNALASKSSAGYSVLGIAVQDSRAALMEFAREAGIVFPIALDLNSKVQRAYRIFGPPATFVIDARGVIRDIILGPMTPERAREALTKVGVRR